MRHQVYEKGVIRFIEMTANKSELEDLMFQVKDAVKQTDRILDSLAKKV